MLPRLAQRYSASTRLRLSVLDHTILSGFTRHQSRDMPKWLGFNKAGATGLILTHGDIVSTRACEWANRSKPAALDAENADAPAHRIRYRLTRFGEEVITQGIPSSFAPPPIYVGGYRAYRQDALWVCCTGREGWYLTRRRSESSDSDDSG